MRKLYPLQKYLLFFFVATILVGELKAQQKLTENFWIRCSNEPRFGPKIEYLININTETKVENHARYDATLVANELIPINVFVS